MPCAIDFHRDRDESTKGVIFEGMKLLLFLRKAEGQKQKKGFIGLTKKARDEYYSCQ